MNNGKSSDSSDDAASRFLAMQRSLAGSDLLKYLQHGNVGPESLSSSVNFNNFESPNNFSSFGLAGIAAAAGLAGLPLSSSGLSSMNNSVPTIAAILAASQEKMVSEYRNNSNGLNRDRGVEDLKQANVFLDWCFFN